MPHDSMLTVILAKGIKLVSIPASGLTKKKKKEPNKASALHPAALHHLEHILYAFLYFIQYVICYRYMNLREEREGKSKVMNSLYTEGR
jgi:hypothetical protein